MNYCCQWHCTHTIKTKCIHNFEPSSCFTIFHKLDKNYLIVEFSNYNHLEQRNIVIHCWQKKNLYIQSEAVVVMIEWQLDLLLPVQSVPITTKVVSSNKIQVYSAKHYVINFVSDLRQVGGFLQGTRFPSPIKLTATI